MHQINAYKPCQQALSKCECSGSSKHISHCGKTWSAQYHMYIYVYTSSTAQGSGGSFKNRKPIGEIGCCESGMAERIH